MNHRSRALLLLSTASVALLLSSRRPEPFAETWKVVAWNDLGMHCMDSDYSVFSILPPFNVVQAQVIDPNGKLVSDATGLTLTYEAVADPEGSINKSSAGKTDFWTYAKALYGASTTPDSGLLGFDMPGASNTPKPMTWHATEKLWSADGVPITPRDDQGRKRYYPMMRLALRDASNNLLAATRVVLPVSDEMDCSLCHSSTSADAAKPKAGWVNDADWERDYRRNILRMHDEKRGGATTYTDLLKKVGYDGNGLLATADGGTPVLCARCHGSNALPGTGQSGVNQLTHVIHGHHAWVTDPRNGKLLNDSDNRASCYTCHPGSETGCLRGAMGSAVAADGSLAMQCQDCHGSMWDTGSLTRTGWLSQPACQNCHTGTATVNSGQIRYDSAFDAQGNRRQPADTTFATNADVPSKGFDLYRFSTGHGGLRCEACHGSTHAVYPSHHGNDNLGVNDLQGHVGTLSRCDACHRQTPEVWGKGPHGMHPIGSMGVDMHSDIAEHQGTTSCKGCHGADLRGTVLSRMTEDRTLVTRFGSRSFFQGAIVGCWACHNGPSSERTNPNVAPVAKDLTTATVLDPVSVTLSATDADQDPLTYRIVSQPAHGRVALSGTKATYHPDPGFSGVDTFTYAASDADIESNLAKVSVTRKANSSDFGRGFPGTGGKVPTLTATTPPVLGQLAKLAFGNSSGAASVVVVALGGERDMISTPFGGRLLVQPIWLEAFAMPAAGLGLDWLVPNESSLLGVGLGLQGIQLDLGARYNLSFTAGLDLRLGL